MAITQEQIERRITPEYLEKVKEESYQRTKEKLEQEKAQKKVEESKARAKDIFLGTKTETKVVSGTEAARIAREQPQPMSIREDVPYTITTTAHPPPPDKPELKQSVMPPTVPSTPEKPKPMELFGIYKKEQLSEQKGPGGQPLFTGESINPDVELKKTGNVGYAALGVAKGVGESFVGFANFFSPVNLETGKSQVPIIEPAISTVKSMPMIPDYASENPYQFIGNVAGMLLAVKVIKVVAPEVPKLSVRNLEIPGEAGNVKLFGFETKGGKALTIGSYSKEGGIGLGTPNLIEQFKLIPEGSQIKIGTALETKAISKAAKLYPEEFVSSERAASYIDTSQYILKNTGRIKNSFTKRDFVLETERLTPEGVKIVLDVTKENKGVISGSFSRQPELAPTYKIGGETFKLNKVARDIDVHLDKMSAEQISLVAKDTLRRFKDAGIDSRLVSEGGVIKNAIEVKQPKGTWEKAVEFLGEGTIPMKESVPDFVLGIKKELPKKEIGGVLKTSINEELRGVMQGTARLRKVEGGLLDIYPELHRVKDIGSEVVSARTLIQSKTFNLGLEKAQTRWESFYPKELVLDQLTGDTFSLNKPILADFSGSKRFSSGDGLGIASFGIASSVLIPKTKKVEKIDSFAKSPVKASNISFSDLFFVSPAVITPSNVISPSSSSIIKIPSSIPSLFPSQSKIPSQFRSSSPRRSVSPRRSIISSPGRSLLPSLFSSPSPSPPSPSNISSLFPSKIPSPFKSPSPSPSPSPYKSTFYRGGSPFSLPSKSNISSFPKKIYNLPSGGKKGLSRLFDVFVRESKPKGKGKIKEYVVGRGVGKSEALNLGISYADLSTARTFRIVPRGLGYSKDVKLSKDILKFRGRKGRSKLPSTSFVEKSKYAIDTPGERKGITLKGLISKRRKKNWRLLGL